MKLAGLAVESVQDSFQISDLWERGVKIVFDALNEFSASVVNKLWVLVLDEDLFDDETLDFLLYGEEHFEQFIIPEFEKVVNRRVWFFFELYPFKEIVQVEVQLNEAFQVFGNQGVDLLNTPQELVCFPQLL